MAVGASPSPADLRLVGRERELARIAASVEASRGGATVLVLRGEPGIGKTALWRAGVRLHRQAGHRVLVARPAEEELHGEMVGLLDLFDGVDTEPGALDADVDPFVRGRAVLRTLRTLAQDAPIALAIDDIQWLDPVSTRALGYALRRIDDEPIGVLVTERPDVQLPGPDVPPIPIERVDAVTVGPLSLPSIRQVIAAVVDSISRPVLNRIFELSGGNPLYALELARAAPSGSLDAVPPASLPSAVSRRVHRAAPEVIDVLAVAAALGPCSAPELARACAGPTANDKIDIAVRDGLLVIGHNDLVVRFAHPLIASAVLGRLGSIERQALHSRLAITVRDPDERARHLALSTSEPDAAVAAELDEAASRAARRGASALAADLSGHGLRLTPPDDLAGRVRRAVTTILHRATAGDKTRALGDCDELIALLTAGPLRAEVITLRVAIDFGSAERFLDMALAEVGTNDLLRGRILEIRGWMAITFNADLRLGLHLCEQALALARRLGDPTLEMLASSSVATGCLMAGRPRPDLMRRALELAAARQGPRLGRWPQGAHGRLCLYSGQLDEARAVFEELHAAFVRSGMEFQRPFRLLDLADLEIASGHLERALELADDGLEAASDAGNAQAAAWLGYPTGVAGAHLGRTERAERAIALMQSLPREAVGQTRPLMVRHVRGLLALTAGEPEMAAAELIPAVVQMRRIGVFLPSVIPVLPDAIEAMALVGDAATCAQLVAELDRCAAAVGQPWPDAAARRGHGLAALAAGTEGAAADLHAAAAEFERLGYPLDAARTRLLEARALRRAGRRNASADVLADAHAHLEAMGAVPWVRQADAELERVAPGREPSTLTPTEARIADLVVAGRRNREIAGELFISVATVEAHLTRMYRKLHVRSRTELARVLR